MTDEAKTAHLQASPHTNAELIEQARKWPRETHGEGYWFNAMADRMERLLHERNAWEQSAAEFCRNMEYYRGLVDQIGQMLGDAAYIADDGSRSEDVLRAKVPELVAARIKLEGTP